VVVRPATGAGARDDVIAIEARRASAPDLHAAAGGPGASVVDRLPPRGIDLLKYSATIVGDREPMAGRINESLGCVAAS
jgi:hypothetical protein